MIVRARPEGNKEVRDIALYSSVFSADVLGEQKFIFRDFDAARHYLVPYDRAADGGIQKGLAVRAYGWSTKKNKLFGHQILSLLGFV